MGKVGSVGYKNVMSREEEGERKSKKGECLSLSQALSLKGGIVDRL